MFHHNRTANLFQKQCVASQAGSAPRSRRLSGVAATTSTAIAAIAAVLIVTTIAGCATSGMPAPAISIPAAVDATLYRQAVDSPVRMPEDRESDASRKPLAFLDFVMARPGMMAMDVSAGSGNTTQLLALVAGAGGRVFAQGATVRPPLEKRLAEYPQPNIVPVARPFDDPVPPGTPPLDLVTINLSYHDIANLPVDRVKMDRALFAALKPGGRLVIIDHAAVAGSGAAATKTLHRIDEALVRSECEQAGFRLEKSADYLRNPADAHDKESFKMEHQTDRFALRFVKPA